MRLWTYLSFALLAGACTIDAAPEPELRAIATVVDGDTLRMGGQRIRLFGIDAPEHAQTCTLGAQRTACGDSATEALRGLIDGSPVQCTERDIDRYQRIVAVCSVRDIEINRWMVAQGWAVAYRAYSTDYIDAEAQARAARRGIWAGDFDLPQDWRKAHSNAGQTR